MSVSRRNLTERCMILKLLYPSLMLVCLHQVVNGQLLEANKSRVQVTNSSTWNSTAHIIIEVNKTKVRVTDSSTWNSTGHVIEINKSSKTNSSTWNSIEIYEKNVDCGPYEYITATDEVRDRYNYKPYYIRLVRCQGADVTGQPTHYRCVPVTGYIKEIKVDVYDITKKDYVTISMFNHTKCEYVCKYNSSSCNHYQTWNKGSCKCDCNQSMKAMCKQQKMRWSESECCTCKENKGSCQLENKDFDRKNCVCVPKPDTSGSIYAGNVISVNYVAILVFFEFVLVVMMCSLLFFCFCRGGRNGIYNSVSGNNMSCSKQALSSLVKTDTTYDA